MSAYFEVPERGIEPVSDTVCGGSECTFRMVAECFTDLVFQIDAHHRWTYLNIVWEKITGHAVAESLGCSIFDFIAPESHDDVVHFLRWFNDREDEGGHSEWCLIKKDGTKCRVSIRLQCLVKNSEGIGEGVIGTGAGISESTESQRLFYEKLGFIQNLLDAIPSPVYFKDTDTRYLGMNAAFESFFGVRRQDLVGKTVFELFSADNAQWHHTKDQQILNHPGSQRFEVQVLDKQDNKHDMLYSKATFNRADGSVAGIIGVMTDISERKRSEEVMRLARDAAEKSNLAKNQFLANMSHEIRTPLNGIIGITALAIETELSALQREYLELIQASSETLLELVNQILDFSKIEAGCMEFDCVAYSLRDTVFAIIDTMKVAAEKKGLVLSCKIDEDIPDGVLGDPLHVRQVLSNLVGNALKFTDRGSIMVRVVRIYENEGEVTLRFSVSDTGIGVPKDKQETILEAFAQADSSITRRFGGTGLGLTICQRLVAGMGGRLWVESEVGQGSTFHFTLKVGIAKREQEINVCERDESVVKRSRSGLKVLLAEDNEVNQYLAQRLFEKLGHTVTLVSNGQEAVDALVAQHFDVVFMDMQMPVMDGLSATRIIRQTSRDYVPVVAMTANAREEDRLQCIEAGMDGYLAKPIRLSSIEAVIEEVLTVCQVDHVDEEKHMGTVFDRAETLDNMMEDEALLGRLSQVFVDGMPKLYSDIQAMLSMEDAGKVASMAHRMKGSFSTFVGCAAAQTAALIESQGREGQLDNLSNLVSRLESEVGQLAEALKREVSRSDGA